MIPIFGSDQVVDVTGAGDTVIATFTAALAAGADTSTAAVLANLAGGIVVMKRGTATVSNAELLAAIDQFAAAEEIVSKNNSKNCYAHRACTRRRPSGAPRASRSCWPMAASTCCTLGMSAI